MLALFIGGLVVGRISSKYPGYNLAAMGIFPALFAFALAVFSCTETASYDHSVFFFTGIVRFVVVFLLPSACAGIGFKFSAMFRPSLSYIAAAIVAITLIAGLHLGPLNHTSFGIEEVAAIYNVKGWLMGCWRFALWYVFWGAVFGFVAPKEGWRWGMLLGAPLLVLLVSAGKQYTAVLDRLWNWEGPGLTPRQEAYSETMVVVICAAVLIIAFTTLAMLGGWAGGWIRIGCGNQLSTNEERDANE